MTLTGTYARTLDEKQRLAVPKRLREQFSSGNLTSLIVAPGTEHVLLLYSVEAFEQLAQRLAAQTHNRVEDRNYRRLFYAQAETVDVDSQSRILIPERLIAFAGLKHEVVMIGVQDHAELWDREHWDRFLEANKSQFDDMATRAFE